MWDWCEGDYLSGLFASSWYNGKRVKWTETRFISNRESFVMGPSRIRQLRATNGMFMYV